MSEPYPSDVPAEVLEKAYPEAKVPYGVNPKDVQGMKKPPLHLVPSIALMHEAMAMLDGASKYDPYNWRDKSVMATVYVAACKRHLDLWLERQECATDSDVHHLGHARACLGIILDAQETGCLTDDRPERGAADVLESMYDRFRPTILRLVEKWRERKKKEAAEHTNT